MYRNNSIASGCSDDVCQDNSKNHHSQQCTCPNLTSPQKQQQGGSRKASLTSSVKQSPTTSSTTGVATNNQSYFPKANVTQDTLHQIDVTQDANLSLLAPLCNTTPPPPLVKEENLSYTWALITSPSSNGVDLPSTASSNLNNNNFFSDMLIDDENDTNLQQHLGFIFHKPTSTQRFLDGTPRIRRRRSTNQKRTVAANSATVTPTNYVNNTRLPVNALMDASLTIDTLRQNYNLSTPPSSASSTTANATAEEPMDIQFDYLTEQLEILSSSGNGYVGDLSNADELAAILNNVLQNEDDNRSLPSSYAGSIVDPMPSNASPTTSAITTTTTSQKPCTTPATSMNAMNRSHCGSFVPRPSCCKPAGTVGGESVVITITPLTNTTSTNEDNNTQTNSSSNNSITMMLEDDQSQQKTTTRIVTCYCGSQCTCPGCLVHPGNFFMVSDPYAGLMMNPSSASSSCYGSDEEDMTSIYSKTNNFMSF